MMKTENELEQERQASQIVTGPYDKQWNNHGVPKVNDQEQFIDI